MSELLPKGLRETHPPVGPVMKIAVIDSSAPFLWQEDKGMEKKRKKKKLALKNEIEIIISLLGKW